MGRLAAFQLKGVKEIMIVMEKPERLTCFFNRIATDQRIEPSDISLYCSLLQLVR
jgi:hypothetical protein